MNLEYVVSQLPPLREGAASPMEPEEFCALVADFGSEALALAARSLLIGGESAHPFCLEWRGLDSRIKECVAFERAKRLGRRPAPMDGQRDPALHAMVSEAFTLPDPLSREKALLHIRWTAAELFGGVMPFSEDALLAYAAKMKLCAAFSRLDAEKGAARFEELSRT